jgi:hypothetical protein
MKPTDMIRNVTIGGFSIKQKGELGISDQYIILDTYKKNKQSNPNRGIFSFDLSYKSMSSDNITLTRDSLSDVIEIQTYPFYLPHPKPLSYVTSPEHSAFYPKLVSSSTPPTSALTPINDTIMVEIKELSSNAVSDPNNLYHTFIYTPAISESTNIFLMPTNNMFIFTDVSEHINRLTLQLRSENTAISFYDDTYYDVLPSTTVVGLDIYITFDISMHGLSTDDRIHIQDFNSGNQVLDDWIKRKEGHLINVTSADSFRLNPDVEVSNIGMFRHCTIYIDKRRIRIQLRFRKLIKRITNYKAP